MHSVSAKILRQQVPVMASCLTFIATPSPLLRLTGFQIVVLASTQSRKGLKTAMQQFGTSPARLVDNVISLCDGASPTVASTVASQRIGGELPSTTLLPTSPTAKTGVFNDLPSYRLPFVDNPVRRDDLFDANGENPIFLRPADVEKLYGIPASTVYDWIADQPTTGFPAVKIAVKDESKRRLVLIPKRLLDEWLIGRSNLQKVSNQQPVENVKQSSQRVDNRRVDDNSQRKG